MTYEELLFELKEVIKETEQNASIIHENLEAISSKVNENSSIMGHEKTAINESISECLGVLQHQDIHRQKIERVISFVCDYNNIAKEKFDIGPVAKNIDSSDNMSPEELEALIKQMNS